MMNPSAILDLARERRRELLEDAARGHQWTRDEEPLASAEELVGSRSARVIDARVRAEARRAFRVSAPCEMPASAR
ncbi:MAG: hypothetical protein WCB51_13440 [Candidatus Dormiibacterota bacterium]